MSAQPNVNPCGAVQKDLEGNNITAVGIRSEERADDTCLPVKQKPGLATGHNLLPPLTGTPSSFSFLLFSLFHRLTPFLSF